MQPHTRRATDVAFRILNCEVGRRQAAAAEKEIAAGEYKGLLHGIPYGLKDLFDAKGIVTKAFEVLGQNMRGEAVKLA